MALRGTFPLNVPGLDQVCDVEYELIDDSECHNFVKGASTYLVPVLLRCMTMQEEGQVAPASLVQKK